MSASLAFRMRLAKIRKSSRKDRRVTVLSHGTDETGKLRAKGAYLTLEDDDDR
jgi:hypothetical protein